MESKMFFYLPLYYISNLTFTSRDAADIKQV